MTATQHTPISFAATDTQFYTVLTRRVNDYFRTAGIGRGADARMWIKTISMLALYFTAYGMSLTYGAGSLGVYLLLCVVMGVGLAGIGLTIMHDANHGAYSSTPWINSVLGYSLNLIGGNAFNWKIQHNVLHHTYTNVFDTDEDISPRGALRMAPESPWKPFHRFQFVYAWFLYGLMTLVWVLGKDFFRLAKYQREGLIQKQRADVGTEWIILIVSKVIYMGYSLLLPMWLLPFSPGIIISGFLVMHLVSGFILAVIFQPAHVSEGTSYFQPDASGKLQNSWAVHQLHTTTNYAMENRLLSWFAGGLNFQIEHHLFPNICHVHYRQLAPIVQSTAAEFGVPYKMKRTFRDALVAHGRLLRELGARP